MLPRSGHISNRKGHHPETQEEPMKISESTVRGDYVSKLLGTFGVMRRTQLMVEISRLGLAIPRPD
jgi:hypothetical protein